MELIQLYMEKWVFPRLLHMMRRRTGEFYKESPDCIILDLMLPKMNGWEVCKMIRLEDKQVPIIMLTGKGESYVSLKV